MFSILEKMTEIFPTESKNCRRKVEDILDCQDNDIDIDLWGKSFRFQNGNSIEAELLVITKSLNDQQNAIAREYLYSDINARGEYIGLLLEFELGTNEYETCGLNYSDIREMIEYPNNYYATICQSALNTVTKFQNGNRMVPISPKLHKFLLERKKMIEEIVGESADNYPIACNNEKYSEHCSTDNLCRTGRLFLRDVLKMPEQDVAGLSVMIENDTDINEEDPVTYLFRRNKATQLQIAGLSLGECQYYMGHLITDGLAHRYDYTDESMLISISKKLGYFKENQAKILGYL